MALPPPKRVELGALYPVWGQNNYPQWSGTRPRVLVGSYSKMLYLQRKATLCMHVIKKKTLDAYAAQYPDAAEPLRSWRKLMERQDFRDLMAVDRKSVV